VDAIFQPQPHGVIAVNPLSLGCHPAERRARGHPGSSRGRDRTCLEPVGAAARQLRTSARANQISTPSALPLAGHCFRRCVRNVRRKLKGNQIMPAHIFAVRLLAVSTTLPVLAA